MYTTPQFLLNAAAITSTAYTLTAGRNTIAALTALPHCPLGPVGPNDSRRYTFAKIMAFATGSDGGTWSFRVLGAKTNRAAQALTAYAQVDILLTVDATLGTRTGQTGDFASATQLFADTFSTTKSALMIDLESQFGFTTTTHSPADNTQAHIAFDTCDYDYLIIDTDLGTPTNVSYLAILSGG